MKILNHVKAIVSISIIFFSSSCSSPRKNDRLAIAEAMEASLKHETLERWYPAAIDSIHGGYLTGFTYDFKPIGNQDKMIVTQARHIWSTSKAYCTYHDKDYLQYAQHGFHFLRDVMWDQKHGGFYQLVNRNGTPQQTDSTKTAYGSAFGIFALAAYFKASRDSSALKLAIQTFTWLEQGSHDKKFGGYFQHLKRDGTPITRPGSVATNSEFGYKDQNSSIHLLEAFTELYPVWPDPLLKERLNEMLLLIRDTIVEPRGNLVLFFQPDWTPISFADSTRDVVLKHANLDHVSFGHDVETAFLLLEASETLGLENDTLTKRIAKKTVDHTLKNGWDNNAGGFYDEGYYFKGDSSITIIRDTKNWWAQAEGLNALLLMADQYPDDSLRYFDHFQKLWSYSQTYLIDHENGDWYAGGLDKQPDLKTAQKGHIWKGNYHHLRSLLRCVERLRGKDSN